MNDMVIPLPKPADPQMEHLGLSFDAVASAIEVSLACPDLNAPHVRSLLESAIKLAQVSGRECRL